MQLEFDTVKQLLTLMAPHLPRHRGQCEELQQILWQAMIRGWGSFFADVLGYAPRQPASIVNSASCGWRTHTCVPGFVYVVQVGDLHKIGRTRRNIASRVANAGRAAQCRPTPQYALLSACAIGMERYLHLRHQKCRVQGEYFFLADPRPCSVAPVGLWNDVAVQCIDLQTQGTTWQPLHWQPTRYLSTSSAGQQAEADAFQAITSTIHSLVKTLASLNDSPCI